MNNELFLQICLHLHGTRRRVARFSKAIVLIIYDSSTVQKAATAFRKCRFNARIRI